MHSESAIQFPFIITYIQFATRRRMAKNNVKGFRAADLRRCLIRLDSNAAKAIGTDASPNVITRG